MTEEEENYLEKFVYVLEHFNIIFLISIGSYIDGHFCLYKDHDKWIISYGDHGIISDFKEESSLEEAVKYLINKISYDEFEEKQLNKQLKIVSNNTRLS